MNPVKDNTGDRRSDRQWRRWRVLLWHECARLAMCGPGAEPEQIGRDAGELYNLAQIVFARRVAERTGAPRNCLPAHWLGGGHFHPDSKTACLTFDVAGSKLNLSFSLDAARDLHAILGEAIESYPEGTNLQRESSSGTPTSGGNTPLDGSGPSPEPSANAASGVS